MKTSNTFLWMTLCECSLTSPKPSKQLRDESFIVTLSQITYFYWMGSGVSQTLESPDTRKPPLNPRYAQILYDSSLCGS